MILEPYNARPQTFLMLNAHADGCHFALCTIFRSAYVYLIDIMHNNTEISQSSNNQLIFELTLNLFCFVVEIEKIRTGGAKQTYKASEGKYDG